ncbi:putative histone-like protein H-NS [Helianthus anomalus]
MFERMPESEKVNFLFSQLQAAAVQISRHTEFMSSNRKMNVAQQLEINSLKEIMGKQHAEIEHLRAENAQLRVADAERETQLQQMRAVYNAHGIDMNRLKERITVFLRTAEKLSGKYDEITEWYNSRNKTIADNIKQMTSNYEVTRKRVNLLWADRCKAQEVLKKRDHDSEDPGNPDIVTDPVASGGTQEKHERLEGMQDIEDMDLQLALIESMSGFVCESSTRGGDVVLRSEDIALLVCHPVTGEELEEGELISELSSEQMLALKDMEIVDDATIDEIPSKPEVVNLEGLEEIVFEGDAGKSTYVLKDGTEFNQFDGD